jgi:serine-protein kinase ATM
MDEVLSSRGSQQFEEILSRFQNRSGWMKIGRYVALSYSLARTNEKIDSTT